MAGALWSLITMFLRRHAHSFVSLIDALFHAFNVPVGPGLLDVVILAIFAAAASRRKRLTLWITVAVQLAGGAGSLVVLLDQSGPLPLPRLIVAVVSLVVAVMSVPLVVLARPAFPGRIMRGSITGALAILIVGLGLNTVFGLGMMSLVDRHRGGGTYWVLARVLGTAISSVFTHSVYPPGPKLLGLVLSFWSAVVAILALVYFLRSQRMPGRTPADDLFERSLLARWDGDSLGYFATRDDRSVIASTDSHAAISYGVAFGVCMAGGDPLGDPQSWDNAIAQWRAQCARFGWIPAAISVSEVGARAFRNQGFIVKSMGDEAVIHTVRFDINAPQMRPLAQSVRRARRAGIDISIRQLADIDPAERLELAEAAEEYRSGEERGFSMSLERILEPIDERTTVVVARDTSGAIEALLTFVPWGARSVSLTLMRRRPDSVNGIIEAMVVALIEHGSEGAIERISLNFAMFRRIFDEGIAVDATWRDRLMRKVMLVASRFWQLDSLYESNARYQPEWVPRYFCFLTFAEATPVIIAAGVLEGFLPQLGQRTRQHWDVTDEHLERVREIDTEAAASRLPVSRLPEQVQVRRDKARRLAQAGMDPWPPGVDLGEAPGVLADEGRLLDMGRTSDRQIHTGGRLRAVRDHGGVVFADIEHSGGMIQLILDASVLTAEERQLWRLVDMGDLIAVGGRLARSRRGEPSVLVESWRMAAKSLRPLPARGTQLDARTRTRDRVVQFLTDSTTLDLLRGRSRALAEVRTVLDDQGYMEVETPMLHPVKGGANARPFVTHLNAYGTDVYLRIAPELYLKRLMVAGLDAIFEMGRSFRNEGADATHNPEFTSLEAYRSGGDYQTMRVLTQELIQRAAIAVNGRCVCLRPVGTAGAEDAPVVAHLGGIDLEEFDLSGQWPVVTVHEAISRAVGRPVSPDTSADELARLCREHGIELPPVLDDGSLVGALYDELVEARTIAPTFFTDFPASSSPLTRKHRRDPRLAERWDLVAFGMELGTAYTELTDPIDQRDRFTRQSLAAAAGDPEAMSVDTDFLSDLELGMPPTGGVGIGMDRMVMLLTGMPIRQILAFPFVRPLSDHGAVR